MHERSKEPLITFEVQLCMSDKTVWFIIGASSGFGREVALYALQAGHTVYGTVRNRERAADAVSTVEVAGGTRCQ